MTVGRKTERTWKKENPEKKNPEKKDNRHPTNRGWTTLRDHLICSETGESGWYGGSVKTAFSVKCSVAKQLDGSLGDYVA